MGEDRLLLYSVGRILRVSSLRYLPSKAEMATVVSVGIYDAPSVFKIVIIPSYGNGTTYHLGEQINVDNNTTGDIEVPKQSPLDMSPLISLSVVYQVGPNTNCIPGISIPSDRGIGLHFIRAGCVTFLIPSEPLSSINASYDTLTLGELKYSTGSTTSDGILQKQGETVTGVELSNGSIPYMYGGELKGAVIEGTTDQVTVTSSYDEDTVTLALSLSQDISTTSSPEFQALTLKPNTGSGSATITTAHSATDRSYEIPDTGGTSQFVMTTGDQTLDGKKTLSDLEVKDELPIGGKTGATYMSATNKGWQRIHISNERKVGEETLKGGILFGHGIRTDDRAEVFINSIGDNVAEIFLGRDEPISANVKWGISSRPSGGATGGNELKIFRGPFLTGGDFREVVSVDAKTGDITLMSETDSKSTTTGGVITKGGLGVAKSIHATTVNAGSIYLSSPGGVPAPLSRYEKFTLQGTITGPWDGTKPITLTVTIIDDLVFIKVPEGFYPTQKQWGTISTTLAIIPLRIRPQLYEYAFYHVYNAGVWGIGLGSIDSSGRLTLYPGANGIDEWNHVAGSNAAWSNINFTYNIA